MLHGGKLKPEYYDSWARYYAKFINAYQERRSSDLGVDSAKRADGQFRHGNPVFTPPPKSGIL